MKKNTKKENFMSGYILPAVVGIGIALMLNIFVGLVKVDGASMNPTLKNGQILVIQKQFVNYKVGDIVVANIVRFDNNQEETIVKRIIAVGGQTIEIKNGKVYVDDKELKEDYIKEDMYEGQTIEKITVPEDEVFVMGDNRNNSLDSRIQGTIKITDLQGKIILK